MVARRRQGRAKKNLGEATTACRRHDQIRKTQSNCERTAMTSSLNPKSISGAAVRAFRRRLGMRQSDFARRVGVTQALVSFWESGKNAVGEESAERMAKVFAGGNDQPSLAEFLGDFETQRSIGAPLTNGTQVMGMTMPIWRWHDQMDLASDPASLESRGIITVSLPTFAPAIAIEMPSAQRSQIPLLTPSSRTVGPAPCAISSCVARRV